MKEKEAENTPKRLENKKKDQARTCTDIKMEKKKRKDRQDKK